MFETTGGPAAYVTRTLPAELVLPFPLTVTNLDDPEVLLASEHVNC